MLFFWDIKEPVSGEKWMQNINWKQNGLSIYCSHPFVLPSPIFIILAQKMWPQLKKAYNESHIPFPLFKINDIHELISLLWLSYLTCSKQFLMSLFFLSIFLIILKGNCFGVFENVVIISAQSWSRVEKTLVAQ